MTDVARIKELENQLALKDVEVKSATSMLFSVQQECIKLRTQQTGIMALRHWIHLQDVIELEALQVTLAYEKLMRDEYGEVNTLASTFFSTPEAAPIEELISRLADVVPLCEHVVRARQVGRENMVGFLGYGTVCHLSRAFHDKALSHLFIATTESKVTEDILFLFEELGYTVGSKADVVGMVPVTFVMPTPEGITTSHREFASMSLESVQQNYTAEVVAATQQAIVDIKEAKSGVLIINGEPGTGKSYLIRAILSELRERSAIVCTPPAQFLMQMDKLAQAAVSSDRSPVSSEVGDGSSGSASLMVMEDIGDLLAQDNVTHHLNETANFLNLTDGLLSLLTDIVFIVSFNHDLAAINPALTRPGRCLGQIKVGKLPAEQVQKLIGGDFLYGSCTLAEVYEMRRTGKPLKPAPEFALPGARAR